MLRTNARLAPGHTSPLVLFLHPHGPLFTLECACDPYPALASCASTAYVIMIAGANEIAASAVGLVYFCAIGPTIIVKLTAPYWSVNTTSGCH
jgi:hypothetical protein